MSQLNFIKSLDENWLFRARGPDNFTLRDIADLSFLYLICLHIMRCEYETAPTARGYAKRTASHSGFRSVDRTNTDLYQFLYILSNPSSETARILANRDANDVLWEELNFNSNTVKRFLDNIVNKKYDAATQKNLLFQIENQLHITVSNYRSMRRIAVEWSGNEIDTVGQRMVITRLLQAFRARARRGDLLPWLERLSQTKHYELKSVCDPETGEGCGEHAVTPPQHKSNMSLLKTLALGALAGGIISNAIRNKK